jgi:hypothetical protein
MNPRGRGMNGRGIKMETSRRDASAPEVHRRCAVQKELETIEQAQGPKFRVSSFLGRALPRKGWNRLEVRGRVELWKMGSFEEGKLLDPVASD